VAPGRATNARCRWTRTRARTLATQLSVAPIRHWPARRLLWHVRRPRCLRVCPGELRVCSVMSIGLSARFAGSHPRGTVRWDGVQAEAAHCSRSPFQSSDPARRQISGHFRRSGCAWSSNHIDQCFLVGSNRSLIAVNPILEASQRGNNGRHTAP
jgi:hypothetical protein